jgi:exosortase/archaeosortase family protein
MKTRPNENPSRFGKWIARNRSDLRFLLLFGTFMGAYYLITLTPPVRDGFFPAYLRWNASISGRALRSFGEELTVEDQSMISDKGPSVQIERGCDAVEPSALFVSAVLASPVPLVARLSAAMVGTLLLLLINLVRVASLFLVRVHYPRAFDVMHLDVWQALFIFLAITLWAIWAARMSRKRKEHEHAAT